MIIEIKNVQFVNKGASLMLYAILEQLKQYDGSIKFCVAPSKNAPIAQRMELQLLQKVNFRKNVLDISALTYFIPKKFRTALIQSYGVVTEADVDVVLDASGFSYGDQWSGIVLKQLALEVSRFKRKNKPYIFMSQALGPFSGENCKPAKKAFLASKLIFSRDVESFKHVKQLIGDKSYHFLSPDITHLVKNDNHFECNKFSKYNEHIALIVNSKMLSNKNVDKQAQANYLEQMHCVINTLQQKKQLVVMLNHDGLADRKICEQLNLKLKHNIEILEFECPIEVKQFIGSCKGVISSRFHGCVSALSQAVPCIAFSWSHKYQMLLDDYDFSEFLISSTSTNKDIEHMLESFEKLNENDRNKLAQQSSVHQESVKVAWGKIKACIDNK